MLGSNGCCAHQHTVSSSYTWTKIRFVREKKCSSREGSHIRPNNKTFFHQENSPMCQCANISVNHWPNKIENRQANEAAAAATTTTKMCACACVSELTARQDSKCFIKHTKLKMCAMNSKIDWRFKNPFDWIDSRQCWTPRHEMSQNYWQMSIKNCIWNCKICKYCVLWEWVCMSAWVRA